MSPPLVRAVETAIGREGREALLRGTTAVVCTLALALILVPPSTPSLPAWRWIADRVPSVVVDHVPWSGYPRTEGVWAWDCQHSDPSAPRLMDQVRFGAFGQYWASPIRIMDWLPFSPPLSSIFQGVFRQLDHNHGAFLARNGTASVAVTPDRSGGACY